MSAASKTARGDAAAAFAAGLIFAAGLGVSGMTQPAKVVGFLDVTGDWDPSLALVMLGAIGVHWIAYAIAPRMARPVLRPRFGLPTRRDIDGRLLGGAVLFGLGWGLAGFCPGPAVVATAGGSGSALIFVAAMAAGMALHRAFDAGRAPRSGRVEKQKLLKPTRRTS